MLVAEDVPQVAEEVLGLELACGLLRLSLDPLVGVQQQAGGRWHFEGLAQVAVGGEIVVSERGQVALVDLVERPLHDSLVWRVQDLREPLQDLAQVDQRPAQRPLDDLQAGQFVQDLLEGAVVERTAILIMNGSDSQLVQPMSIVLLAP